MRWCVDDRIFPEGGGFTWFGKPVVAVSCGLFLGVWFWTVPVSAIRRRQRARLPQTCQ